jgi:hypothetical protein
VKFFFEPAGQVKCYAINAIPSEHPIVVEHYARWAQIIAVIKETILARLIRELAQSKRSF